MNRVFDRIRRAIVGVVSALAAGAPAVADDTEVFRFTPPPGMRPNVLFVIDDSISMGTDVLTQPAYDAAVAYLEPGLRPSRGSTGRPAPAHRPSCTTADWFNATAMKCDTATQAFAASGQFWDDHMAQYDPSGSGTWRDLAADQKDRVVECDDDRGVHGDGGSATYAANNSSPNAWSVSSAEELNWNSRDEATLYSGNYMNWYYGPGQLRSRLDVVQNVVDDLLETLDGVNVGLMDFNTFAGGSAGSDGGSVSVAIADIATNRYGDARRRRGADTQCREHRSPRRSMKRGSTSPATPLRSARPASPARARRATRALYDSPVDEAVSAELRRSPHGWRADLGQRGRRGDPRHARRRQRGPQHLDRQRRVRRGELGRHRLRGAAERPDVALLGRRRSLPLRGRRLERARRSAARQDGHRRLHGRPARPRERPRSEATAGQPATARACTSSPTTPRRSPARSRRSSAAFSETRRHRSRRRPSPSTRSTAPRT